MRRPVNETLAASEGWSRRTALKVALGVCSAQVGSLTAVASIVTIDVGRTYWGVEDLPHRNAYKGCLGVPVAKPAQGKSLLPGTAGAVVASPTDG